MTTTPAPALVEPRPPAEGPAAVRGGAGVVAWAVLVVLTAVVWLGLVRLGWAFLDRQLDWRYVAEQSRPGLPWWYRMAGVWAGMEGSLLLFTGIVGGVAVVATRRAPVAVTGAAVVTVGALAAIDLGLASPFRRLDLPAVGGFGMNPILEHPAMTIHPPLLYLGLAAAGGAAVATARVVAGDGAAASASSARRWHLVTLAALTAAMTLGGAWSYLEQGWGGYWAWDPVENTSLVVWLAALVALHVAGTRGRGAVVAGFAPWVLALAGAILVRYGATPSIHGFAEQPGVGRALLALTVLTVVATAVAVARTPPATPTGASRADRQGRDVTVVLVVAATVVVVAGSVFPVLAAVGDDRDRLVRGEFFSRTVGPLAFVAVPFVAGRLRRWDGASTIAHAGFLVLVVGVAASTFDRVATVPIPAGATLPAAGVDWRNDGVAVVDGPRPGTDAVEATLGSDGDAYRPRIVVYPERGGRLAEVAARPGWWTDTLVVLERAADDGGVVVTVHRRHGMVFVWLGAMVMTAAAVSRAAALRPTRRTSCPDTPRRPPKRKSVAFTS